MYVPHTIFERKPILGVLLGFAGLAMSLVAYYLIQREYRAWGKTPTPVDLRTVIPPQELHGQWVEVRQSLKIDCQPAEIENQAEHQLLFGRVQSTYFLAAIERSDRYVVLERHKTASCEDVKRGPFIGVLTEVNPRLRSTLESRGMVFPYNKRVMLLCLSCGPKEARDMLAVFLIVMAGSVWLIVRFWRKHQQLAKLRQASSFGSPGAAERQA